ncbi:hypothetical protein NPIL_241611, partial [Nephila pilipes]
SHFRLFVSAHFGFICTLVKEKTLILTLVKGQKPSGGTEYSSYISRIYHFLNKFYRSATPGSTPIHFLFDHSQSHDVHKYG